MREHQGIRKGEGRAGEIEEREGETKEGMRNDLEPWRRERHEAREAK